MKKTTVEWLELNLLGLISFDSEELRAKYKDRLTKAKEMEKQHIIESGNSCAFKQHLHNDMIDKMSNAQAMIFTQTDNLTFGEQYYNETFKKENEHR